MEIKNCILILDKRGDIMKLSRWLDDNPKIKDWNLSATEEFENNCQKIESGTYKYLRVDFEANIFSHYESTSDVTKATISFEEFKSKYIDPPKARASIDIGDTVEIGRFKTTVYKSGGYFLDALSPLVSQSNFAKEIGVYEGMGLRLSIEGLLGYEPVGAFPECETLEDLEKVIEFIQKNISEKKEEVEFNIGDRITLGGLNYELKSTYAMHLHGTNDQIFIDLGLSKYDFFEKILGYASKEGGDFPVTDSFEDLVKLIKALQLLAEEKTPEDKASVNEYSEGDIVYIYGLKYKLMSDHARHQDGNNGKIFSKLGIDKGEVFKKVLGYEDCGTGQFPYCRSFEDVVKFVKYLMKLAEERVELKDGDGATSPRSIDKKKLLQKAIKKYTRGVKYKCVKTGLTETIGGDLDYFSGQNKISDGCGGRVYWNGEWAEIVSKPLEPGKWYKTENNSVIYYKGGGCASGVAASSLEWFTSGWVDLSNDDNTWKEAESDDVKATLFAYAKEKYPEGVRVNCLKSGASDKIKHINFHARGDNEEFSIWFQCGHHNIKVFDGVETWAAEGSMDKKLEVGKWYKNESFLIFYKGGNKAHGFTNDGTWYNNEGWGDLVNDVVDDDWVEADINEVRSKLEDYAVKKYSIGSKVKCLSAAGTIDEIVCLTGNPNNYGDLASFWVSGKNYSVMILDSSGNWAKSQLGLGLFPFCHGTKYNIGDLVEIVSPGGAYSTYTLAFENIPGFSNKEYNRGPGYGDKGVVFHVCKHKDISSQILVAINLDNGHQCLMSAGSIKKCSLRITADQTTLLNLNDEVATTASVEWSHISRDAAGPGIIIGDVISTPFLSKDGDKQIDDKKLTLMPDEELLKINVRKPRNKKSEKKSEKK